ncbi:unnamed protein product [Chrysoparadoxa australica]
MYLCSYVLLCLWWSNVVIAALSFEQCANFRVVLANRIYRSASLDSASPSDQRRLREELGVKTFIDLRGEDERSCTWEQATEGTKVLSIPLLEANRFYEGVVSEWPWERKVENAWWGIFDGKKQADLYYDSVNANGLPGLYRVMLRTGKAEILQALTAIADPTNHPVVFNCAKGKDRTGIIAVLLQHCMGVPLEEITRDYTLSESLLPPEDGKKQRDGRGILWEQMAGTPAWALRDTLDAVEKEYSSLSGYLDTIGFPQESRQQLRDLWREAES